MYWVIGEEFFFLVAMKLSLILNFSEVFFFNVGIQKECFFVVLHAHVWQWRQIFFLLVSSSMLTRLMTLVGCTKIIRKKTDVGFYRWEKGNQVKTRPMHTTIIYWLDYSNTNSTCFTISQGKFNLFKNNNFKFSYLF